MPTKQVCNCRVGDIILYKTEESRIITDIAHVGAGAAWTLHTTDLAGENPRFDTYNALDEVKVWGTQEALF